MVVVEEYSHYGITRQVKDLTSVLEIDGDVFGVERLLRRQSYRVK
jgi:hypothetical protein